MKTGYSLKPEKRGRVYLFRHPGEAFIFWISLAGVIALAVFAFLRYFPPGGRTQDAVKLEMSAEYDQQLEELRTEIEALNKRIETLEQAR